MNRENGKTEHEIPERAKIGPEGGVLSRRQALATIGIAGAAAAAGFVLPGPLSGTVYGEANSGNTVQHSVYGGPMDPHKLKKLLDMSYVVPITIAELRTAAALDLDYVYFLNDPGQEGHFIYDPLDTTSADNTGTLLVNVSGARLKRIQETDYHNVRWFGAKGDGTTDDSSAIQLADTVAAAASKRLYFPEGTYKAYGLLVTTSWFAHGKSVVENLSPTANKYNFVRITGRTGLSLEGLTFDGGVSSDPSVWSSSNYNAFTGGLACYLFNSTDIRLTNCTFRNSVMSPLRIEKCSRIIVENCTSKRGRGNYGDAIYVAGSDHVRFDRCSAEDYTRIGFVCEQGSWNVSFSQCHASYGHDQSKLYGGGEFNAGFWSENSENVTYSQCVAENNTHCGFTVAPGVNRPYKTSTAPFVLDSCVAIGNGLYGFIASDSKGDRFSVTCSDCFVFGSRIGMAINAYHANDTVTLDHCYFRLDVTASGQNATGVLCAGNDKLATIRISDCLYDHSASDPSLLMSSTATSGDIVLSNNAKLQLFVNDCSCVDAGTALILKALQGTPILQVRNCLLQVIVLKDFQEASFDNCRFTGNVQSIGQSTTAGNLQITRCSVAGGMDLSTAGRIRFESVQAVLSGTQRIGIVRNTENRDIRTEFVDCRFEKDIAASDYAIRIEENGTLKPLSLFRGCIFYNSTDTATATRTFIWNVQTGTNSLFSECYSDDTVANLLKTGSVLSAPSGNTLIDLH
ncbi:right-handed parallel beta-helix repeat-containing protein [Paenibacillus ginsengarvi]|uniref:Pectate lyase superfamily protein domain-containing protein n=1 Tax=Paenibacillus ginsengarvi TaxID=400777 RepID=A0A3B0BUA0_9BACL|nr:right-handed parallel beta-helix repeat-containing protein [Paenibacillus ginsengarvi]RKN75854.1 hypothetical protein D7M11_25455 [Paenibacillus ginsengarvi]